MQVAVIASLLASALQRCVRDHDRCFRGLMGARERHVKVSGVPSFACARRGRANFGRRYALSTSIVVSFRVSALPALVPLFAVLLDLFLWFSVFHLSRPVDD